MVRENLEMVRKNIAAACKRAGSDVSEVTLLAVSKTKPISLIEDAIQCGQKEFGENKVQEIVNKYEDFITILLSQFYGKEARNKMCQQHVFEYIGKIEKIVAEGMKKGEIKQGDPKVIASEIYALIASTLVYKMKNGNEIDIIKTYKEFEKTLVEGLKAK